MIAVDSGLRHYTCYSYLHAKRLQLGVIVSVAVGRGLEVLQFYDIVDKQTLHDYMTIFEETLVSRHANDICVFDGLPKKICKGNIGIQKTGEPRRLPYFQSRQYGAYIVYYDFDVDETITERAIKLNALAHNLAYKYTRDLARVLLRQYKCIVATGVHPVVEQ